MLHDDATELCNGLDLVGARSGIIRGSQMSETTIEITVSGDNAAEILQRITDQLPDEATIVDGAAGAAALDDSITEAVLASASLPQQVTDWFAGFSADAGMGIMTAVVTIIAILFGAWAVDRMAAALLPSWARGTNPSPDDGLARTGAALRHGLGMTLRIVLFYVLARIAFGIVFAQGSEALELGTALLGIAVLLRTWLMIIDVLAAPTAPERRATGLADAEAAFIRRAVVVMLAVLAATSVPREFVISVVDAREAGAVVAIVTRVISGLAIAVLFIAIRKPVGRLIILGFAARPADPGFIVRTCAALWPVFYILLQMFQIGAEARGYLSGTLGDEAGAIKRSFGALVLAPFVVAGIREFGMRMVGKSDRALAGRIKGLTTFVEGAFIVGTGLFILYAWDIDPFATDLVGAQRILPGLVSAGIIIVVGTSLWRMTAAFLGTVSASELGAGDIPEEPGGPGGSRMDTVLPVLRAVAAALIGTVTVLLALSSLGVQIAPLLAGAGILGLAIGFGAQKVVEDVISGVLYLVEDAFRKGEYIETKQGKGIVEAIMLRSVRLRHHRGPIFTIPFSAMGTIQNHSRDWVTVKLSFEVSAEQDLEVVRKLVKKVGTELMEDPELQGQFLAPLKSQGAVDMIGSNYKIGVKFTSEPGKQFLIRRKALTAIQKAFKENHIEMAAPRVIVDTHEQAAAAAAKFATDAQTAQTGV